MVEIREKEVGSWQEKRLLAQVLLLENMLSSPALPMGWQKPLVPRTAGCLGLTTRIQTTATWWASPGPEGLPATRPALCLLQLSKRLSKAQIKS